MAGLIAKTVARLIALPAGIFNVWMPYGFEGFYNEAAKDIAEDLSKSFGHAFEDAKKISDLEREKQTKAVAYWQERYKAKKNV